MNTKILIWRWLCVLATTVTAATLAAVFVLTRPALPWESSAPPESVAPRAAVDSMLPERLRQHVRKVVGDFMPRDHKHVENLDALAAYLHATLSQVSNDVVYQSYEVGGHAYRNVVARFGPDTSEIIVVGAHYDSFDELPAADDNASGVAGLIEVARLLAGQPLRRRVELVAYTLEEPPYFRTASMGSAVHAKSLRDAGKQVALMLSLECIGYFSDEPGSQEFPVSALGALYPTTGNFIALVGHYREGGLSARVRATMRQATPLRVHSINAPPFVVGIDFSDHLNYWHEGFVGMMVTDTAFTRNRNYHTEDDTPEKLDYRRMADVVRGVATAVIVEASR